MQHKRKTKKFPDEGRFYVDRFAVSQESKPNRCRRTEAPRGRSPERNGAGHKAGFKMNAKYVHPPQIPAVTTWKFTWRGC